MTILELKEMYTDTQNKMKKGIQTHKEHQQSRNNRLGITAHQYVIGYLDENGRLDSLVGYEFDEDDVCQNAYRIPLNKSIRNLYTKKAANINAKLTFNGARKQPVAIHIDKAIQDAIDYCTQQLKDADFVLEGLNNKLNN